MGKLTAIQVRSFKPKERAYTIADGGGLSAHIAPSGVVSWRYRYRYDGKHTTFVVGQYPEISLANAREKHKEAKALLKKGINPTTQRKKEREKKIAAEKAEKLKTGFEAVAHEWFDKKKDGWSKNHANSILSTLRKNVFPAIGNIEIDKITPPMILSILRKVESRGALEIARKVLQLTNAIFRYGVQTGRVTYNPASDMKGVLKSRKVKHMNALSQNELPEFLNALTQSDIHITTKLALRFTILTATRTLEVRGAVWNEIDMENMLWRIPLERMKMDSPHNVPLSQQAMAILERAGKLFGKAGYIFPGIRQGSERLSENTMLYALYRLGYHGRATVHGFRSTFSTIANESGFPPDVIEKALAHEQRNKVRAAYNRSEYLPQRVELMQWWADMLDQMEHGAEIIPIRARSRK